MARLYASLLMASIISAIWYVPQLFAQSRFLFAWKALTPTFQLICYVFPILFLMFMAVFMTLGIRRSSRRKVSGAVNIVHPFALVFVTSFLLLTGIYANYIEPKWIEVTNVSIHAPEWHIGSKPLKVLQLSDLHIEKIGYTEKHALEIVRTEKPDLILLTGDYIGGSPTDKKELHSVKRFLGSLSAPYGVYAVDGNWESPSAMRELINDTDIRNIAGRSLLINTKSGLLQLSGISWNESIKTHPKFPYGCVGSKNEFSILLCHRPWTALKAPSGIDLILSGHTHGGQVRLPFMKYFTHGTRLDGKFDTGLFRINNRDLLYINRGLGTHGTMSPRIRFQCRPEITIFTIGREQTDSIAQNLIGPSQT